MKMLVLTIRQFRRDKTCYHERSAMGPEDDDLPGGGNLNFQLCTG